MFLKYRMKLILLVFLLTADLFLLILMYTRIVDATGGAFPYTKHGGATGNGVDRSTTGNWPPASGAGTYAKGECTHCHEPHGSFGGDEPYPNYTNHPSFMTPEEAQGPDPYLLFADNNEKLCLTCHETFQFTGKPSAWGEYGFYQGRSIYLSSTHGDPLLNTNMLWPGISGATDHPRKARPSTLNGVVQKGICLNCHTPHGILGSAAAPYDTATVPATNQIACISPNNPPGCNPSVTTDYLIPRQLIAWEEALCETCHDGSPANTNIQAEIDKRGTYTGSDTTDSQGGSGHLVDYTSLAGRHTVSEEIPLTMKTTAGDLKHVECYDCHNPHAVKAPTGVLGDGDGGRIKGMKYIDISGVVRDPALGDRQPYVYEICFKCHGDSYSSFFESSKIYPTATVYRPPGLSNKRLEFNPSNSSYHPVAGAGRNTTVAMCLQLKNSGAFPTLDCSSSAGAKTSLQNLTINCTDCHNTDATGGVPGPVTESNLRTTDKNSNYTGTSPVGPHGSRIATPTLNFNATSDNGDRSILRDYYFTGTLSGSSRPFNSDLGLAEFQNRFKLCFNCHDYRPFYGYNTDSTENRDTNFAGLIYGRSTTKIYNLHYLHIRGGASGVSWFSTWEACMTCHYNIHSNVQATNTQYDPPPDGDTHLINFAPDVVTAMGGYTQPRWWFRNWTDDYPIGQSNPGCALTCHGETMGGYSYSCSHSFTSNGVTTDTCNDY